MEEKIIKFRTIKSTLSLALEEMKSIAMRILLAFLALLVIEVLAVTVEITTFSSSPERSVEMRRYGFGIPFRSVQFRIHRGDVNSHLRNEIERELYAPRIWIRPRHLAGDVAVALVLSAAIAWLLGFWCIRRLAIGVGLCIVFGVILNVFLRFFQSNDLALWYLLGFVLLLVVAMSATVRDRPFSSALLSLLGFYPILFFVQRASMLLVPSDVRPAEMSWKENVIFPGILLVLTYALCSAWFGVRNWLSRRTSKNVAKMD